MHSSDVQSIFFCSSFMSNKSLIYQNTCYSSYMYTICIHLLYKYILTGNVESGNKQDKHLVHQCLQREYKHKRAYIVHNTQHSIHSIIEIMLYTTFLWEAKRYFLTNQSKKSYGDLLDNKHRYHRILRLRINVVRFVRINATNLTIYDAIKFETIYETM